MNEQTLEKMKRMKLYGMYKNFRSVLEASTTETLTPDELLAQLIDSEWDDRNNRAIDRSLRNARFRYKSSIEMIEYNQNRGIDPTQVHRLAECTFIRQSQNLIITGSTGTGYVKQMIMQSILFNLLIINYTQLNYLALCF